MREFQRERSMLQHCDNHIQLNSDVNLFSVINIFTCSQKKIIIIKLEQELVQKIIQMLVEELNVLELQSFSFKMLSTLALFFTFLDFFSIFDNIFYLNFLLFLIFILRGGLVFRDFSLFFDWRFIYMPIYLQIEKELEKVHVEKKLHYNIGRIKLKPEWMLELLLFREETANLVHETRESCETFFLVPRS